MPKTQSNESVLHDWVHELTFQMQALLMTAIRGPDENNKYNSAKAIIRYFRGAVIKPAGNWSGRNDNDFMWGEYRRLGKDKKGPEGEYPFHYYCKLFWQDHDEYPHHFIMHLVHCAEVIGYKHPNTSIAVMWSRFYYDACDAFHMNPESLTEMDRRLNDFGLALKPELTKQLF